MTATDLPAARSSRPPTSPVPRPARPAATELAVAHWRLRVQTLYAHVRALAAVGPEGPARAHAAWIEARNTLFATHPASPIPARSRPGFRGLRVGAYDPGLRFEVEPTPALDRPGPDYLDVPTGTDGVVPFSRVGVVVLPGVGALDVWALRSYAGGLFLPVADPGPDTFGGGRYVLDTVKGADLGQVSAADGGPRLVVDLNFAYHPSCAYDPAWACPLAPAGNRLDLPLTCGELMP